MSFDKIMSMVKGLCDPVLDNLKEAMRQWAKGNQKSAIRYISRCQKRLKYIKSVIKKHEKP